MFSPDSIKAIEAGILTHEQYLKVRSYYRETLSTLFSADGRAAFAAGIITLEQYLTLPAYERKSLSTLFSADGRAAFADGIITLEQYLTLPDYERESLSTLFSADGRAAFAAGIITLEQYLTLLDYGRESLSTLFSADGRAAFAAGIITLEQYLTLPDDERESLSTLFSADGRAAFAAGIITLEQYLAFIIRYNVKSLSTLFSADGRAAFAADVITLEQYLKVPGGERESLSTLFSADGRAAFAAGIITLEQYLSVGWLHREYLSALFSADGRAAFAAGVITLKQYLTVPGNERESLSTLFSADGRAAFAAGVITLEQYLAVEYFDRQYFSTLFSADGRTAFAAGVITLEQYLAVPRYNKRDLNILFSADGRRAIANNILTTERALTLLPTQLSGILANLDRILAGDITVAQLVFTPQPLFGVAGTAIARALNGAQSTHISSVHASASQSAVRLSTSYGSQIKGTNFDRTITEISNWAINLPIDQVFVRDSIHRMKKPTYDHVDPTSRVSTRHLLALSWKALHDDTKRIGTLEGGLTLFAEGLEEIQTTYGAGNPACAGGAFNKIVEKLVGIHPDAQLVVITLEQVTAKFPIIVKEETFKYLDSLNLTSTKDAKQCKIFEDLLNKVAVEKDIKSIWDKIEQQVATRILDEFGNELFDSKRNDPRLSSILATHGDITLEGLEKFQIQLHSSAGYHAYVRQTRMEKLTSPYSIPSVPLLVSAPERKENIFRCYFFYVLGTMRRFFEFISNWINRGLKISPVSSTVANDMLAQQTVIALPPTAFVAATLAAKPYVIQGRNGMALTPTT